MRSRSVVLVVALAVAVITLGGLASYLGLQHRAERLTEKKTDELAGKLSPLLDFGYESLSVNPLRQVTRIHGITVNFAGRPEKVKIRTAEIRRFDDAHPLPRFLNIVLEGVRYDGGGAAPLRPVALGYTHEITARMELDYSYQESELTVRTLGIKAANVGDLELALHLGNADFSDVREAGEAAGIFGLLGALAIRYQQVLIHSVRLTYKDDSLMFRAVRAYANDRKKPLPVATCVAATVIQRVLGDLTGGRALTISPEARAVLKEGMNRPLRISVTAKPKRPVPVGRLTRMIDAKNVADLLGLRVEIALGPTTRVFTEGPRVTERGAASPADPERLERYYQVYSIPHVIHVRKAFNAFLDGRHEGIQKNAEVLKSLDGLGRRYIKGRFVVISIQDSPFGGKSIIIAFPSNADRLFQTWVYGEGEVYELGAFAEFQGSPEETAEILCRNRALLEDTEHSL